PLLEQHAPSLEHENASYRRRGGRLEPSGHAQLERVARRALSLPADLGWEKARAGGANRRLVRKGRCRALGPRAIYANPVAGGLRLLRRKGDQHSSLLPARL